MNPLFDREPANPLFYHVPLSPLFYRVPVSPLFYRVPVSRLRIHWRAAQIQGTMNSPRRNWCRIRGTLSNDVDGVGACVVV